MTGRLFAFWVDYRLAKLPTAGEFEVGIEPLDKDGKAIEGLEGNVRHPSHRAGVMPLRISMKLTDAIKRRGAEITSEKVRIFLRTAKDWKLLYERVLDMKLEFSHDPKRHGGSGGGWGGGGLGGSGETFKGAPADQWFPEMKVSVDWEMTKGDADYEKLKEVLKAFNRRLYDTTDGQVAIARFKIYDRSTSEQVQQDLTGQWRPNPPGASPVLFHRDWPEGTRANPGAAGEAMVGQPKSPGNAYVGYFDQIQNMFGDINGYAGVVLHELFHGTFGVLDEYMGPNGAAKCVDSKEDAARDSACIMYDPYRFRELCRSSNHDADRDTDQSQWINLSCYEAMVKRLLADVNVKTEEPTTRILGPVDPPDAVFEDHLE